MLLKAASYQKISEGVQCTELIKLLVKFNGILYMKYEYVSFNSEVLDQRHSWIEFVLLFFLWIFGLHLFCYIKNIYFLRITF